MTVKTFADVENELNGYFGTENYYRITPFNDMLITDGIKRFCEVCECFWAITDFVALKLYPITKNEDDNFSVVRLEVKNNSVKFSAFHDTGMPEFWNARQKDYGKTIPTGTYEFYLIDNVLLLKSEY